MEKRGLRVQHSSPIAGVLRRRVRATCKAHLPESSALAGTSSLKHGFVLVFGTATQETCIIFDWDDTLLPSSFLEDAPGADTPIVQVLEL